MSEEKVVANESVEENVAQVEAQESPTPDPLIAEAKKYRKRAQLAESKIAELEKKFEAQENAKLKENEEFKTLAEKLEAENASLRGVKEEHKAMISKRKDDLLSKLPEDKREQFKDKDLDVLEFMVSEMTSKTPSEPNVHNQVRNNKDLPEDWTKLSPEELRKNWNFYFNRALNRNKKN
tara:strand:+ start:1853 stop:2389 length:537 start_codon:yes stop_codon:yes gene_type:complete